MIKAVIDTYYSSWRFLSNRENWPTIIISVVLFGVLMFFLVWIVSAIQDVYTARTRRTIAEREKAYEEETKAETARYTFFRYLKALWDWRYSGRDLPPPICEACRVEMRTINSQSDGAWECPRCSHRIAWKQHGGTSRDFWNEVQQLADRARWQRDTSQFKSEV